jgi:hypothetical protein
MRFVPCAPVSQRENKLRSDVRLCWFVIFLAEAGARCGGSATCPTCQREDAAGEASIAGQANDASVAPASACPANEPTEGETCSGSTLTCWYGHSPRPDCRDIWGCTLGRWHATRQGCVQPRDGYCPASQPDMSTSCTGVSDPTASDECVYGNVLCECPCVLSETDSGVLAFPCRPVHFACVPPPTTSACPSIAPNIGTSCTPQGVQCVYGDPCLDGIAVLCRSAVWSSGFANCPE